MRFSAFALFVSESVFAAMRNYAFFSVQLSWLYTFFRFGGNLKNENQKNISGCFIGCGFV